MSEQQTLVRIERPPVATAVQVAGGDDPGGTRRAATVQVVIPTYNRAGSMLGDALASVRAQTFTDYGVIVVDDGSNDHTREQVEAWDPAARYVWQPNQGVAEARNHALRHAAGSDYVAFLDSDDRWEPAFLERTIGYLRDHPDVALVYTDFVSTDASGRVLKGHRKRPHGGEVTAALFASTFVHTSAVVARTAILRDAGGFDGRLTHNEDYDLWLRLSLRHPFGLIPEPLCLRRCHAQSLSHDGCSPDILLRKAELLEHFYETGGGRAKIPEASARRRLARLYYTAGKAFVRAGKPADGLAALRRSTSLAHGRAKTGLWLLRARVQAALTPAANNVKA